MVFHGDGLMDEEYPIYVLYAGRVRHALVNANWHQDILLLEAYGGILARVDYYM
jgi:hypothetical protein